MQTKENIPLLKQKAKFRWTPYIYQVVNVRHLFFCFSCWHIFLHTQKECINGTANKHQ